ncbi:unnamed protein product [Nyctereutes procyonoides]|uniref:Protein transport protein Sec61 subunit gamma n=1 Tax=Nyctereutes procyonoides TaxID=34880 RepID=A0A811ZTZ9_NYCPR|nr:unnamed protein product [Nyctereutes procyonoides]
MESKQTEQRRGKKIMQIENSFRELKDTFKCTKPDRKEFQKIAMATALGFAIIGFIGLF